MESNLKSYLLLGGAGWKGRNLVKYLVDEGLSSSITVADKGIPAIKYFTPEFTKAFESVKFIQADLSKPEKVDEIMEAATYNVVVNFCGQNEHNYDSPTMKRDIVETAQITATKSVGKCDVFIQISSAFVYEPHLNKKAKENSKIKPWTKIAELRLLADEIISKMTGLNCVILRIPFLYGFACLGMMNRWTHSYIFKKINKKIKWPWMPELKINCLHMKDLCRAITHFQTNQTSGIQIYNLSDPSDLDQKKLATVVEAIMGVKVYYFGKIKSTLALVTLDSVIKSLNEGLLEEWFKILKEKEIDATPVSPLAQKHLCYKKHLNIDGSAILQTGFQYQKKFSEEEVREQLNYLIEHKIFPSI